MSFFGGKRWIASALGKFVYKLRNATKGITRICKVNNGAVAICNGANRGLRTWYLIHSLSHKKRKHRNFDAFFFGGKRWIRTTEGGANRFTVCSLWPLGNLPTLGAGGRSRTNNLLITNQLLCH